MPLYKYKYVKDGEQQEEIKEFPDKGALYLEVRMNKGSIVSAEEVKARKNFSTFFSFAARVKTEDIINFAKNLAVMIEAGLPLSRALSVLERQSRNKRFTKMLEHLNESINKGDSLSSAMETYPSTFSNLFVSMVRSGEESGKVTNSLRVVADQMEKSNAILKKVRGAMIYPIIIICLMIIIGILLMVFMVPTLSATFQGLNVPLPLPTRILISISNFIRDQIIFILIGFGFLAVLVSYALRTTLGKRFADFCLLKMPIFSSMIKELNSARTARTLSSLISSGVNILPALKVTRDVLQNSYYKDVISKAEVYVQKGENLSAVFEEAENLYPVFVSEMASVGEETGNLSEMLKSVADYYESELDQKTKNLSTIIEPLLMVFIGVGVGIFAIAMLAPTYSLVDVIGAN